MEEERQKAADLPDSDRQHEEAPARNDNGESSRAEQTLNAVMQKKSMGTWKCPKKRKTVTGDSTADKDSTKKKSKKSKSKDLADDAVDDDHEAPRARSRHLPVMRKVMMTKTRANRTMVARMIHRTLRRVQTMKVLLLGRRFPVLLPVTPDLLWGMRQTLLSLCLQRK